MFSFLFACFIVASVFVESAYFLPSIAIRFSVVREAIFSFARALFFSVCLFLKALGE